MLAHYIASSLDREQDKYIRKYDIYIYIRHYPALLNSITTLLFAG